MARQRGANFFYAPEDVGKPVSAKLCVAHFTRANENGRDGLQPLRMVMRLRIVLGSLPPRSLLPSLAAWIDGPLFPLTALRPLRPPAPNPPPSLSPYLPPPHPALVSVRLQPSPASAS